MPATLSSADATTRQTTDPLAAPHPQCRLLRAAHGLCLALSPIQLPIVADGVLPYQALPPARPVAPARYGSASCRARARRPAPGPGCRQHGQPACEDRRGIGPHSRLRCARMREGMQKTLLVDTLGLPIT